MERVEAIDGEFGETVHAAGDDPAGEPVPDKPGAIHDGICGGRTGGIDRIHDAVDLIIVLKPPAYRSRFIGSEKGRSVGAAMDIAIELIHETHASHRGRADKGGVKGI